MAVAPDEWENLAIEADNASLEGKEADPDAIPNDAQAYAQQLKDQRNEIRKKELEDALATFALDPKAERRKNKKPFVCCCPGVRRFFGLCYFKNLHEAVIDGDTSTIISKLQNAQAKDARAIKRLGGVERTVHGKKHDGEENKDHFQGKAAALSNKYDKHGRTPLSLAVKEEREDIVDLLLSLQADPDMSEDLEHHPARLTGASPVMHAVLADLPGSILKLQSSHADFNLKNKHGMTAVMLACLSGDADLLEMLLEQGGDPEAKDKGGWTPLIYAAYGGNLECVKAILETGASIKAKDKHKHTAYDWAMYIRKNLKSFKHGQCEAYLEEFKPQLVLRRRG